MEQWFSPPDPVIGFHESVVGRVPAMTTSPLFLQQCRVQPVCPARTVRGGFTLVEMLAVLGVIAVITALVVPAVTGINGSNNLTKATYDVASALEMARTYALANNTYVWVGLFEEDGAQSSPNPTATNNGGRIILSVVASKDGTRYDATATTPPGPFGSPNGSNPVALIQVNKIIKVENVHMAAVNDPNGVANNPARPAVPVAYQTGDAGASPNNTTGPFAQTTLSPTGNQTTFTYPAPTSATNPVASPQYTFTKIIEFNPQGEASKITENTYAGAGPQSFLEIALQPVHGNLVDPRYAGTKNAASAIQIEGLTGQTKVYRP